jgi:hypothetical protein
MDDHVHMHVQERLTESSVFQVRKSQLRAYVQRDQVSEQCMRSSRVSQG